LGRGKEVQSKTPHPTGCACHLLLEEKARGRGDGLSFRHCVPPPSSEGGKGDGQSLSRLRRQLPSHKGVLGWGEAKKFRARHLIRQAAPATFSSRRRQGGRGDGLSLRHCVPPPSTEGGKGGGQSHSRLRRQLPLHKGDLGWREAKKVRTRHLIRQAAPATFSSRRRQGGRGEEDEKC